MNIVKFKQALERLYSINVLRKQVAENERRWGKVHDGRKESLENWVGHITRHLDVAKATTDDAVRLEHIKHIAAIAIAAMINNVD